MKEWARFDPTHSHIREDEQGIFTAKFGVPTANEQQAIHEAHWLVDTFEQIKKARPTRPVRVIVDMSSIDDSEFIPGEVWKMYLALVKDSFLERVAVVGGTEAMRNIINFYFRFWARGGVKFVPTTEEALAWLKQD